MEYMRTLEIIRAEILSSGLSRNKICQQTGIDRGAMSRFMNGGGIKAETADKLLDFFGYELSRKRGD